jgi:transposase
VSALAEEGRPVSSATVRKWIFRWKETNTLKNQHRSGQPSTVTLEMAAFMDRSLDEDDELSSSCLHQQPDNI